MLWYELRISHWSLLAWTVRLSAENHSLIEQITHYSVQRLKFVNEFKTSWTLFFFHLLQTLIAVYIVQTFWAASWLKDRSETNRTLKVWSLRVALLDLAFIDQAFKLGISLFQSKLDTFLISDFLRINFIFLTTLRPHN